MKDEVGIDPSMEFNRNAVFKDQNEILWFGSSSGVLEYNPHLEKDQSPPPALSILSVIVNNREQELMDEMRLPPGRHTIRIDFMGINLANPGAVTYSYMMEGQDDNWSRVSHENHVIFTKIPDGKYTFNLRAFNSDGTFNENPLKLQIHISVPMYKRWWIYVVLVIVLISGVRAIIKRREHNFLLETERLEKIVLERTHEVVEQKEEIEGQRDAIQSQNENISLINQNITDSIIYASRIQKAVFPPIETLASIFPESFILNRPQYIVSGDFFWIANKKGKHIFTVTDCTGHGVPGAFMSMLGITLLNEIVNNQQCVEADEILNRLKNEIIRALRQTEAGDSASDGMDMALCVFDPISLKLQYAGGFNPLVLIRDGELIRYQADPMPVGIGALRGRDFTRHELEIQKGDLIYLYSDGYEDQFGGEKDSKFSRKRFRELLMEIHKLPLDDQKARMEERLDEWMDGKEQIDDIMILGIKF
jgi:serine phosphatase RsbU (regulator of sigma subunit)